MCLLDSKSAHDCRINRTEQAHATWLPRAGLTGDVSLVACAPRAL